MLNRFQMFYFLSAPTSCPAHAARCQIAATCSTIRQKYKSCVRSRALRSGGLQLDRTSARNTDASPLWCSPEPRQTAGAPARHPAGVAEGGAHHPGTPVLVLVLVLDHLLIRPVRGEQTSFCMWSSGWNLWKVGQSSQESPAPQSPRHTAWAPNDPADVFNT